MKIAKITCGHVTQIWDTESEKFVSQSFEASHEPSYENAETKEEMTDGDWDKLNVNRKLNFGPYADKEPYFPFDMVQPAKKLLTKVEKKTLKRLLKKAKESGEIF